MLRVGVTGGIGSGKTALTDWLATQGVTIVDADLAANTLGWQWAAGCGADAAPYFRIFNPTSQQQKFDPEEKYIDRWVVRDDMYPEPIVDHAEARKQALSALKQVTGK